MSAAGGVGRGTLQTVVGERTLLAFSPTEVEPPCTEGAGAVAVARSIQVAVVAAQGVASEAGLALIRFAVSAGGTGEHTVLKAVPVLQGEPTLAGSAIYV